MKLTIIFISAILIFSACKQSDYSATDHPDFQKNVLPQAQRLIDSNKILQGLAYLDSSYRKLKNPGYGDILAVYNVKTKTLFNNNADEADLINAMKYADSAISLINNHQLKNKYRQQYISLIFHRGDMLVNKDRFDDAYASYYKAKQILDSAGMSCEQADYYARLGLIYYKQGKFYKCGFTF
ncbi:hypothetical protein [Pedobacter rhizosphaerae]|uniref:Tetratricopeptide repeat-containing protein n=1 Tax=Pedobacter rhizosphaerae TaxID=390241 RepID=A0A1H9JPA9_9SPHI|nr:hypothetical protein [Pedobacter rhizosphaerae]SEQ88629.1 hypothetical protein SAMN04488023_10211 [Pedobacter rhizosphaerae]